jgi:hypothetical protein
MRTHFVTTALTLATVLAVSGRQSAQADTAYGRQCNRVFPTSSTTVFKGKQRYAYSQSEKWTPGTEKHSCRANLAVAEDNRGAGLDYMPSVGINTFDGTAVTGCLMFNFPLNRGWLLAGLDITAKPVRDACGASPCQAPYCGTGGNFVVFATQYGGVGGWKRVGVISVNTPNWAEYKVLLPNPAPLVMVCRAADGPARDDLAIDSVKGCAVQP